MRHCESCGLNDLFLVPTIFSSNGVSIPGNLYKQITTTSEHSEKRFTKSTIMGYTHINGLWSQYPTRRVKLPLQYPILNDDDHQPLGLKVSKGGIVEHQGDGNSFISAVHYKLDSDMQNLFLCPVSGSESNFQLNLQQIVVQLPRKIFAASTLYVHQTFRGMRDDPSIAIDIIDDNFLFISVRIRLADFVIGDPKKCLSLDHFEDWVHISVPYSFELKAEPLSICALAENDVLVSLKDGTLLHFKRLSFLADFEVFNFNTSRDGKDILFERLARPNGEIAKKSKKAGVLDMEVVHDQIFATLSFDKTLKLYNCDQHTILDVINEKNNDSSLSDMAHLPTNCLRKVSSERTLKSHLFMIDPTPSTRSNNSVVSMRAYEISNTYSLERSEIFTFEVHVPSYFKDHRNQRGVLHVHDYVVTEKDDIFEHRLLWKHNNLTLLTSHSQDVLNGGILSESISKAEVSTDLPLAKMESRDLNYYRDLIWSSGRYDTSIITNAKDVLVKSSTIEPRLVNSVDLRKSLEDVIELMSVSAGVSAPSLWHKLFLICEEFKKTGQEPLSIYQMQNFVLVCEANGVGVFRTLHFYEDFSSHPQSGPLKRILEILRTRISSSAFNQLKVFMESPHELSEQEVSRKARELFDGRFKEHEVGMLIEHLDGDLLSLVEDLSLKTSWDDHRSSRTGVEKLDPFMKSYAIKTFLSILEAHRTILVEIASLFMLCETNQKVIQILNSIRHKLRIYKFLEQSFGLSFDDIDGLRIQNESVGNPELAVFWDIFGEESSFILSVRQYRLNEAFDIVGKIMFSDEFENVIVRLIVRLINCDEWRLAKMKFLDYLDVDKPLQGYFYGILSLFIGDLDVFLASVANPEKLSLLLNSTLFQRIHPLLKGLPYLRFLVEDFGSSGEEANSTSAIYFHKLSAMCERYSLVSTLSKHQRQDIIGQAVAFEEIAVEHFESSAKDDDLRLQSQKKLFELSLKMGKFEGALKAFESLLQILPYSELRVTFAALLKALIAEEKQQLLFGGLAESFCKFHHHFVDKVLLEEANEDLVLWRALKAYELLYSWRLCGKMSSSSMTEQCGDKRGASEALYIFITRFRLENDNLRSSRAGDAYRLFKLKILELYMIIINCVQSFDKEEDMWIRRKKGPNFEIVGIQTLLHEHSNWLHDLENDIPVAAG